jgi:hypothetical protein
MISATEVADADAESRTSDEVEPAAEVPPSSAGDRARAKFCAIVAPDARTGPRAFFLPAVEGLDEEALLDMEVSMAGASWNSWVGCFQTDAYEAKLLDDRLSVKRRRFRYAIPHQIL